MKDNAMLSDRIKRLCKIKKITQNQMLEDLSINKNFFYGMERKDWTPTIDKIVKIADYLDCSVDYLVGRTDTVKKIDTVETMKLALTINGIEYNFNY